MSNTSEFYVINKHLNYSNALIIKINNLSPDKYFFDKESKITLPRLVEFDIDSRITNKQCHYHNDFNSSTFIYFRNFDININNKFLIPSFICEKFRCLSCDKIYDKSSGQCCSLINSPILIIKAKLTKITIPKLEETNMFLHNSRLEFISNHYPDLTNMIMLKK